MKKMIRKAIYKLLSKLANAKDNYADVEMDAFDAHLYNKYPEKRQIISDGLSVKASVDDKVKLASLYYDEVCKDTFYDEIKEKVGLNKMTIVGYEDVLMSKADYLVSEALERDNKHLEGLRLKGSILRAYKVPEKAIKIYNYIIDKVEVDLPSIYYRALSYIDSKEPAKAIRDLDACVEVMPDLPHCRYTRAETLIDIGNYKSAINDLDAYINLEPDDPSAYFLRGYAKRVIEDYRGSISDFVKSLEMNPEVSTVYLNLAIAQIEVGLYDEAIDNLVKGQKLYEYPDFSKYKSKVFYLKYDYENALKEIEEAITAVPNNPDYLFIRGIILSKMGRKEEAMKEFDNVIEMYPDYKWAYEKRAELNYELGRFMEAEDDKATVNKLAIQKEYNIKEN